MSERRFTVRHGLYRSLLLFILLIAALLRFVALPDFPPGISHDEVAEVLIAEGILRGEHALFFHQAYGQEPLFLYLVAGAVVILGHNVLALRFVSAAVGLLTVAAGARLARRLFGPWPALLTAAGLSIMLWPVFWSRVGLRGMTLPLLMCLAADALWVALFQEGGLRSAWCSGLGWGLAMYTYLASRGIPILLAAFVLYLLLFHRALVCQCWRELTVVLVVTTLLALPLFLYLRGNPEAQTRVYEVQAPLAALRKGNVKPVLDNVPRIVGMFSFQGDATERNNYPGRPVFPEPVWALLFFGGMVIALLTCIQDPRCAWVLLWLGVMLTPSWVTTDAPNFVRTLGALPVVMMLPAVGLAGLWRVVKSHWARWGLVVIVVGAFGVNTALTVRDYFVRWVQIPEVGFVWQHDLLAVARWLDAHPELTHVTVGGLSNATMDAPSLALLLRRDDVQARWSDPGSPLGAGGGYVLPQVGGYFLVPSVVPLNDAVYARLRAGGELKIYPRFRAFLLPPHTPLTRAEVLFEGNISLVDFAYPDKVWHSGETLVAFSTWQAEPGPYPPLKAFVHLVDAGGEVVAQHDGLDAAARFWLPGDWIVQMHMLPLPPSLPEGGYTLRLGLYDRETLVPYRPLAGGAFVEVGSVEVRAP